MVLGPFSGVRASFAARRQWGRPAGGPRRRRIVLLVLLHRLLARFDLSGVARDRADDVSVERALDQRRVHLAGQIALREVREGAGKRGFGGNLRASLPPQDPAQRLIDAKALDEAAGGGKAKQRLGDKGPGQRPPIFGRPTGSSGRLGNEGFQADHIENGDEPPERLGQRVDFLTHPGKQKALDVVPAREHRFERIGHVSRRRVD